MVKSYSSREIKTLLKKKGFVSQRVCGSHEIFKRGKDIAVVNLHLNQAVAQRIVKEFCLV